MARTNLKLVEDADLAGLLKDVTLHLTARRSEDVRPNGPKPTRQEWSELSHALDLVSAAIALSRPSRLETAPSMELEEAEHGRLRAEESEGRLAQLLEKAISTLGEAKDRLAAANARADAAEADLNTLRRILIGPVTSEVSSSAR